MALSSVVSCSFVFIFMVKDGGGDAVVCLRISCMAMMVMVTIDANEIMISCKEIS